MLNPQPTQVAPRLFWPALFAGLFFGLAAWSYAIYDPNAFTQHWLRNHIVLKSVHSLALGQLGLIFLAVSAQAGPVLFHVPQSNQGIALWGQGLWALGVLLLVSFFAGWRQGAVLAACLGALGLAWGLLNLQARAVAGQGQARSFAWQGLGPAFLYLGLMVLLGGAMAWGLLTPVLPQDPLASLQLHVHVGLWGFAALAIFGFLPKLLRLFQASTGYAGWPLKLCFKAVHLGLALLLGRWLGAPAWVETAAGAALLTAALAFALQLALLLKAARSPRLDSSLAAQLGGVVFLLAAAGLDAWLLTVGGSWQAQAAAVTLALGGFVSLVLLGTLQRICAVLAWFQRFYQAAKSSAVPTAWDLAHPAWAWSLLPLQAAAAAGLAYGIWRGDAGWVRFAGISGCLAQLAAAALAIGALTRGKAQPFPDGQNPYEEWARQQPSAS
jgi:hypothetical protein